MDKPFFYTRRYANTVQSLMDDSCSRYTTYPYCEYVVEGKVISKTYGDMRNDAQKIEAYLAEIGVKHVGLLGATGYQWLSVFMACLHAGVVVVPLDVTLPEIDLIYQIEHADIEILICDEKYQGLAENVDQDGKCQTIRCLGCDGQGSLSYETNRFTNAAYSAPPVLNGPELAMIVYTSGTSGKPKAVMLSQRNLSSAAHYGSSIIDVNVGDHLLVLLPNHHMYTIGHCFLSAMFVGGALCLNDSIYNTFSNIKKFNIDIIVVVPAVMRLFKNEIQSQLRRAGFGPLDSLNKVKRALVTTLIRKRIGPNLKQIVCGGAPLDPSYVAFFKLLDIELLAGYGMTECAPLISCQVYRHVDFQRPDSVGRPGVCCEAKIVDREIWVSGEHVMLGYYKDPDETAKALTDEGWLKTGDIGHLDEEGFLYITGRLKNLIILGNGENVSPEELEAMFDDSQNIDGIIVSANNDLDIISAEIHPAKTVVDSMGLEQAQTLIRQEVKEQNKNLPLYKQIQIINFREQPFEKTSSLKIKR